MNNYYLQWWNEETKTWEGDKIYPAPGNLAEQYPGGYKFWLRREEETGSTTEGDQNDAVNVVPLG